jgi:alkylation response protein AidB-like acyl-CoA dehydrogenase
VVRRRLKYVELRPASSLSSDAVRRRLADLVRERQALRDDNASGLVLEQNRLAIVQAQLELARTLVSEHTEAVAELADDTGRLLKR